MVAEVANGGEGRTALLHFAAMQPVILEGSAAVIWSLIDGHATDLEIVQRLASHYSESVDVISTQTLSFLGSLADQHLIEPALTSN